MKYLKYSLFILLLGILFLFLLDWYVVFSTKDKMYTDVNITPKAYVALVLGAKVHQNGNPSIILKDRLDSAIELYNNAVIKRILLSGDHGTKTYDEVNSMKKYLIKNKIPTENIFLDHAGFDTYNSLIRAKKIFKIDTLLIVTQKFHLKRSLFIANKIGLSATGYIADKHLYPIAKKMYIREKLANIKALLELVLHRNPKFLGKQIPITGNSKKSYD